MIRPFGWLFLSVPIRWESLSGYTGMYRAKPVIGIAPVETPGRGMGWVAHSGVGRQWSHTKGPCNHWGCKLSLREGGIHTHAPCNQTYRHVLPAVTRGLGLEMDWSHMYGFSIVTWSWNWELERSHMYGFAIVT